MMRALSALALASFVFAAACSPPSATTTAPPTMESAGPVVSILPDTENDSLQVAASVVKLDMLQRQGDHAVRVFGMAGGDPAMNGLHTYVSFYMSPAEGSRVFSVGDFLDYRVLTEAPGRVQLEIRESTLDEAKSQIGERTHRLTVGWSIAAGAAAPEEITVTPTAQ